MEADGPLYRRFWKVWLFPGCCLPCNAVLHPCRASVSQNKTRYEQDGFDLDLTYVTSRIIVHGFPATGIEHIYRNPRTEVQRLLDKYHKEHYKVYNFANEAGRTYPDQIFQGRVERFPFTDHTCPPLESVVNFCESAKAWLDMDENNVVSLHCKAGKGRAGIMAACLMVRLGETASDAVSKYDTTRVSDLKGLTVVNQRKWPFMYERLVKEVWGVQDSIGMVPGQDPDLRAPVLRAACLREISIQLQSQTAGSKGNSNFLRNVLCYIYQQEPMGKTLVHRGKMVEVAPKTGEAGLVLAAILPRSVVVKGTFQVLVSAAFGTVSTQKRVIDLWWNTTFLVAEGGDHTFQLSEMDVSPLRLAGRLHQANAKLGVLHTQPDAESPQRRRPLKPRVAASISGDTGGAFATAEGEGGVGNVAGMRPPKGSGDPRLGAADRSLPQISPEKGEGGDAVAGSKSGEVVGRTEAVISAASSSGGDSAAGSVTNGGSEVASAATDATREGEVEEKEAVPSGDDSPKLPAASSETKDNQGALSGDSSPSLPGPSPAGMISPVWTFEGRTPSNKEEPSGNTTGNTGWTRSNMWPSNHGTSSGDVSSPQPTRSSSFKMYAPEDELREKRRHLQRSQPGSRSMDSLGNSFGSTSAPTGTSSSMPWGGGRGGGGSGTRAVPSNGSSAVPSQQRGLMDSESDDQLAVGASAFEGGGLGPRGPTTAPSSNQSAEWAMEMEMAFAQERRRWEEHQQCLETELDWALAARARAEARSEENAARAEVLEGRLTAWRSEYSVVECDVKQAVGLLEMSLSGLVSAETALKRWKGEMPAKAYDDILACLTKGDTVHSSKD